MGKNLNAGDPRSPRVKAAEETILDFFFENERLRALLNDPRYIQMKADYNRGHLSWANMIEERERGLL